MQRGITLFNELTETIPQERKFLGRNKDLICKRNQCLLDRLFYYKTIYRWDYELVKKKISEEFFISEATIPSIMERAENQLYLRTLKLDPPSKKKLEQKWPHLNWAA